MSIWGLLFSSFGALLILLFIKRFRTQRAKNLGVSIDVQISDGITKEEYARHCLNSRTDPAKLAWKSNREKYLPVKNLSTNELCPFCSSKFVKKKTPSRRSKFSCKNCGNVIYADPWQRVFPTVYLDDKQALICRYLGKLSSYGFFAALPEDFWWQAQQKDWTKRKARLTDSEAADVLWGLFNYNVQYLHKLLPKEEEGYYREHAARLQTLMAEYRSAEKELRREVKNRTKKGAKKTGDGNKLDLVCPYCDQSLGLVARPSRSSSRKCKKCGEQITVNPHQKLFPTAFLSNREAYLADTLGQLNHWVFTNGKMRDFNRVKKRLGKTGRMSNKDIVAILRDLIVENIEVVHKQTAAKMAEYNEVLKEMDESLREELFDDSDGDPFQWEVESVEQLLREFDEEVSRWSFTGD